MSYFEISPVKLLKKLGITTCEKQNEIIQSVEENFVTLVLASRRSGKSTIASACATSKLLIPEMQVALASPFAVQSEIIFSNVVNNSKKLELKPEALNRKDRYLRFPWQSELRTATLKNKSSIVGRFNHLFCLDECALANYLPDHTFIYQEILPTLLTCGGHLLAITTPRGRNYFYDLWNTAKEEKDWNTIKFTVYDVNHISKEKIETLKNQYYNAGLEKTFAQEFLCEYTSYSGKVYDFDPIPLPQEAMPNEQDENNLVGLSLDPGLNTGCLKCIVNNKGIYITDIYESTGSIADHAKFIESIYSDYVDVAYIDSAAQQQRIDLAHMYDLGFINAIKSVETGINFVKRLKGKIFYNKDSVHANRFMKEWSNYSMNNDKIAKKDDHLLDCLRYFVYSSYKYFPEYFETLLAEELDTEQLLKEAV